PFPLPFLAPRPGGCKSLSSRPVSAEVIDWSGGRLRAIVTGEPIVTAGHLTAPETPLAWATDLGVVLWAKSSFLLIQAEELSKAHHCTASPDGGLVACVQGQEVVLFQVTQTGQAP